MAEGDRIILTLGVCMSDTSHIPEDKVGLALEMLKTCSCLNSPGSVTSMVELDPGGLFQPKQFYGAPFLPLVLHQHPGEVGTQSLLQALKLLHTAMLIRTLPALCFLLRMSHC